MNNTLEIPTELTPLCQDLLAKVIFFLSYGDVVVGKESDEKTRK